MDVTIPSSSLNSEDPHFFYNQLSLGLLVNSGVSFICNGHSFLMLGVYTGYWAFSICNGHFFLMLGVYIEYWAFSFRIGHFFLFCWAYIQSIGHFLL